VGGWGVCSRERSEAEPRSELCLPVLKLLTVAVAHATVARWLGPPQRQRCQLRCVPVLVVTFSRLCSRQLNTIESCAGLFRRAVLCFEQDVGERVELIESIIADIQELDPAPKVLGIQIKPTLFRLLQVW
jgi:hypothetical protein